MGKWLAAGSLVLLVLVIVLWYQMRSPITVAAATPKPLAPAAVVVPVAPVAPVAAPADADDSDQAVKKVDVASDAFFNRFTDHLPSVVSGNAMRKCYTGGIHRRNRDQMITLEFVDHIKDGEVTISDVKVKKSTLDDAALESCFISEVGSTHWHDDSLPDTSQPDEVTMTPERIAKKYIPRNYEGPAAPPNTPR